MSLEEYEMTHVERETRKFKEEAKEKQGNKQTYLQRQKRKEKRRSELDETN